MEKSKTEKPVTGFRGRSGRTFRAKLKLEQKDDGKWRVEFDEDWAKEPRPPTDRDGGGADGNSETAGDDGGARRRGARNGARAAAASRS